MSSTNVVCGMKTCRNYSDNGYEEGNYIKCKREMLKR